MFESSVILTGVLVFFARICDVSIGTVRTIVTVQGRTVVAFFLAIMEVTIWILVASTVINQVKERPILVIFYAFGYATGNVIGIMAERRLAFGLMILKVITRDFSDRIAARLRDLGQPVTIFRGEGMKGSVSELYIACRRRDLKWIIPEVLAIDDEAFYVLEQARDMRKMLRPIATPIGGWRSIGKQK